MKVTIEVFLDIEGAQMRSGGSFYVDVREYKKDPDFAAAVVAYQHIQGIIRQTGYRETEILKVVYEGNKDITDLTRKVKPLLPPDNLPF